MKIIIFLLIILMTSRSFAQEVYFVSFGLDPKLAIVGAYDYDKSPVFDSTFKAGTRLKKGLEMGVGLEYAELDPYYLSGNLFINKVIPNWKRSIEYSIGTELLWIDRGRFNGSEKIDPVWTFGINSEVRIRIKDWFKIGFIFSLTHRKDLKKMFNDTDLFKINGRIRFIFEKKR